MTDRRIEADRMTVEPNVVLEPGCVIRGEEVILRQGVHVGRDTQITCDRLEIGRGSEIGSGSSIIAPEIFIAEGCGIGSGFQAELNEYFRIGRRSNIGKRVVMVGQGFRAGEFLWLKDDVVVGGGGARGPRAYFTIGDRSSVFDRCYVNLSEEVTIGSDTALSSNVVLLTHGAWQPALLGFAAVFAPISIGDHSVVYLNSTVMPGVRIGSYSTIGASSLVLTDVPDRCLAAGSPARIRKGPEDYPHPLSEGEIDALLTDILGDYVTTLPAKGVEVVSVSSDRSSYTVEMNGRRETICYLPLYGDGENAPGSAEVPTILIAHRDPVLRHGDIVFFDLSSYTVTGDLTAIAEDLRDYLRRRAIRFFTDMPFQTLPLANLQRLKARVSRGQP